jgi:hypothetical protein
LESCTEAAESVPFPSTTCSLWIWAAVIESGASAGEVTELAASFEALTALVPILLAHRGADVGVAEPLQPGQVAGPGQVLREVEAIGMGCAYPRSIPAGLPAWIRVDSHYHH